MSFAFSMFKRITLVCRWQNIIFFFTKTWQNIHTHSFLRYRAGQNSKVYFGHPCSIFLKTPHPRTTNIGLKVYLENKPTAASTVGFYDGDIWNYFFSDICALFNGCKNLGHWLFTQRYNLCHAVCIGPKYRNCRDVSIGLFSCIFKYRLRR